MTLEKIFSGLKIWKDCDFTRVAAPREQENDQHTEIHCGVGWAHQALRILHDKGLDSFLRHESSLFEWHDVFTVRGCSLREDEECIVIAGFFNEPLPLTDGLEGLSPGFLISTSRHVNAIRTIE